jgi:hypothetical protein
MVAANDEVPREDSDKKAPLAAAIAVAATRARASADSSVLRSRWPGLNRRPTVYETVALPLSYIGRVLKLFYYGRSALAVSSGVSTFVSSGGRGLCQPH